MGQKHGKTMGKSTMQWGSSGNRMTKTMGKASIDWDIIGFTNHFRESFSNYKMGSSKE